MKFLPIVRFLFIAVLMFYTTSGSANPSVSCKGLRLRIEMKKSENAMKTYANKGEVAKVEETIQAMYEKLAKAETADSMTKGMLESYYYSDPKRGIATLDQIKKNPSYGEAMQGSPKPSGKVGEIYMFVALTNEQGKAVFRWVLGGINDFHSSMVEMTKKTEVDKSTLREGLLKKKVVICAGECQFGTNGLNEVANFSGHFMPSPANLINMIRIFFAQQIITATDQIVVKFVGLPIKVVFENGKFKVTASDLPYTEAAIVDIIF